MAAEASWSRRNQRSTLAGVKPRTSQAVSTIMVVPRTMPMSGESTMKAEILAMPEPIRPDTPSAGRVAPIMPPASACEEEEGSPHSQVSRFQTMAPTSAAKITTSTMVSPWARRSSKWMIPLPMVLATLSWAPQSTGAAEMKLKKAAQATAMSGVSTRVETTVAMELAASWKPLMKSKASATTNQPDDDGVEEHGGGTGGGRLRRARGPGPRSRWPRPRPGRWRPR